MVEARDIIHGSSLVGGVRGLVDGGIDFRHHVRRHTREGLA
jgi:hypothetical protein